MCPGRGGACGPGEGAGQAFPCALCATGWGERSVGERGQPPPRPGHTWGPCAPLGCVGQAERLCGGRTHTPALAQERGPEVANRTPVSRVGPRLLAWFPQVPF